MKDDKMQDLSWSKVSPYYEISLGETLMFSAIKDEPKTIQLESFDHQYINLRVNHSRLRLPLGACLAETKLLPLSERLNIADIEGLRIGADVTRFYRKGSKYSLSLLNLAKDARLFIGKAGKPISPSGLHKFLLPNFKWDLTSNWLTDVPYGWHLGVDLYGHRGHPIVSVSDGRVIAIRNFDPDRMPEDYWGNNLAILGDDGILYCFMHWDKLEEGIAPGGRVKAGQLLGTMGRSGYDKMQGIPTHLHFEMMILKHPEKFSFAYELDPKVLPTPNRFLQQEVEGHVINPFPFLLEWYQGGWLK